MISPFFVWYHAQYTQKHTFPACLALPPYDFTHDNIAEIMKKGYDIKIIWYQQYLSYCFAYDMAWKYWIWYQDYLIS